MKDSLMLKVMTTEIIINLKMFYSLIKNQIIGNQYRVGVDFIRKGEKCQHPYMQEAKVAK